MRKSHNYQILNVVIAINFVLLELLPYHRELEHAVSIERFVFVHWVVYRTKEKQFCFLQSHAHIRLVTGTDVASQSSGTNLIINDTHAPLLLEVSAYLSLTW